MTELRKICPKLPATEYQHAVEPEIQTSAAINKPKEVSWKFNWKRIRRRNFWFAMYSVTRNILRGVLFSKAELVQYCANHDEDLSVLPQRRLSCGILFTWVSFPSSWTLYSLKSFFWNYCHLYSHVLMITIHILIRLVLGDQPIYSIWYQPIYFSVIIFNYPQERTSSNYWIYIAAGKHWHALSIDEGPELNDSLHH